MKQLVFGVIAIFAFGQVAAQQAPARPAAGSANVAGAQQDSKCKGDQSAKAGKDGKNKCAAAMSSGTKKALAAGGVVAALGLAAGGGGGGKDKPSSP